MTCQPNSLPLVPVLSSPLPVCTFNVFGLCTPLPAGDKTRPRCAQLVRFLRATNTLVMGIQEHHLSTPDAVTELVSWFKSRSHGFLTSMLSSGFDRFPTGVASA